MRFAKEQVERDGFNLVGRRGEADVVDGTAAPRLRGKGKLVIGKGARNAARKRIEVGALHGRKNLRARRGAGLLVVSQFEI
jgi:hypothetical protein